MNVTNNLTVSPFLVWLVQTTFDNIFQPSWNIPVIFSVERTRLTINVLFLSTEIGGFFCNFYLMCRLFIYLRSMQVVKSHYRAIIVYNQYTYISIGLGFHLSLVGVVSCALILSSHVYFIYIVNNNQRQKKPNTDSLLSCNYVPFLRDALSHVYIYILLTLMSIYRRADIHSISKSSHPNQRNDLVERRQRAKMVLLHSLPWVLSLGLSLPRGLLDMRLDFRSLNPYKILESALSEELCLRRSNDSDIINLCMWSLQAWIPIILCFSLCIIYSCKDRKVKENLRNRRHSITTLGGRANDSALYSSSRTLYSLHNYKEEVIKLVKSSPISFYLILSLTLILRCPYSVSSLIDYCHYLLHSEFVFSHVIIILLKDVEYLHFAILPLFLMHSLVSLVRNSFKINEIRQKLKKMTENDEILKNSIHRYDMNHYEESEKPFMLSTV